MSRKKVAISPYRCVRSEPHGAQVAQVLSTWSSVYQVSKRLDSRLVVRVSKRTGVLCDY